jgi:hypothetical protein
VSVVGRSARVREKTGGLLRVAAVACVGAGACGGAGVDEGRDVVPTSRDVVGGAATAQSPEGYDYVARRPLAVVALAEGRGLDAVIARAAVDRLADRLDACVTEQSQKGGPVEGAARVVAQISATGAVAATQVRIDPGGNGASSAVLCLVAPLKLLTFPAADHDGRGIAIEALWGHVQAGR